MRPTRIKRSSPSAARTTLGKRQLEELIEEAIVDAYGESEQRVGFLTMLEDGLAFPFETEILGAFCSVQELEQAIYQWLATWNNKPKPFIWKAPAVIIDKVRKCR